MNKQFIVFFTLIVSSISIYGQEFIITIYNKTLYDLDSIEFCDSYYYLNKDSSITITNCDTLLMQDYTPFGVVKGYAVGCSTKLHDSSGMGYCGNGIHRETSGNLQFDIGYHTNWEDGYELYWRQHKIK